MLLYQIKGTGSSQTCTNMHIYYEHTALMVTHKYRGFAYFSFCGERMLVLFLRDFCYGF